MSLVGCFFGEHEEFVLLFDYSHDVFLLAKYDCHHDMYHTISLPLVYLNGTMPI